MQVRYLVKKLFINSPDAYQPFDIVLPNDVKEIVGVAVSNNATPKIGSGVGYNELRVNGFRQRLANSERQYRVKKNVSGRISYFQTQQNEDLNIPTDIVLSQFNLGSISLISYEKSGLFYSTELAPNKFELQVTNATDNTSYSAEPDAYFNYSSFFNFIIFENKNKIFQPVSVQGISKEIKGFLNLTDFGRLIIDNATKSVYQKATENYITAYYINIYLKYTV